MGKVNLFTTAGSYDEMVWQLLQHVVMDLLRLTVALAELIHQQIHLSSVNTGDTLMLNLYTRHFQHARRSSCFVVSVYNSSSETSRLKSAITIQRYHDNIGCSLTSCDDNKEPARLKRSYTPISLVTNSISWIVVLLVFIHNNSTLHGLKFPLKRSILLPSAENNSSLQYYDEIAPEIAPIIKQNTKIKMLEYYYQNSSYWISSPQRHDPCQSKRLFIKIRYHVIVPMLTVSIKLEGNFLTMCYTFFSVTYTIAHGLPMLGHQRDFKREARFYRVPLYGSPNQGYCAMISIGIEKVQQFCVLVDTGSSNLAIASTPHPNINEYFNTNFVDNNFHELRTEVSVSYTGGSWSGMLAKDLISVGSDTSQSIEAYITLIKSSRDFFIKGAEWEGIMGLAYPPLAKPDSSVECYWDSLRRAKGLSDVFSLQFCPPLDNTDSNRNQGQLVFGDHNDNLYAGSIFYTSITKEDFYRVLITNMSVDGIPVDVHCREFNNDQTIVDSGTTDIYLPTTAFNAVQDSFLQYFENLPIFDIPKSFWIGESKFAWPANNLHFIYSNFPTLYIAFASHENEAEEFSLAVTPQIYLRKVESSPEEQQSASCSSACDFFLFGIKKRNKGSIIGGNVILGFTTIFDRDSKRIGFAESTCQYQDHTEGAVPHILGPYPRDVVDCSCHNCSIDVIVYVAVAVAIVCAVIIVICSIIICIKLRCFKKCHRRCCRCKCKKSHSYIEEQEPNHTANDLGFLARLRHVTSYFKHLIRKLVITPKENIVTECEEEIENEENSEVSTHYGVMESNCSTVSEQIITNQGSDELVLEQSTSEVSNHNLQSDQLVTGKDLHSSYIDERYPKLALSEDSHNCRANSVLISDIERMNNESEDIACDSPAPDHECESEECTQSIHASSTECLIVDEIMNSECEGEHAKEASETPQELFLEQENSKMLSSTERNSRHRKKSKKCTLRCQQKKKKKKMNKTEAIPIYTSVVINEEHQNLLNNQYENCTLSSSVDSGVVCD